MPGRTLLNLVMTGEWPNRMALYCDCHIYCVHSWLTLSPSVSTVDSTDKGYYYLYSYKIIRSYSRWALSLIDCAIKSGPYTKVNGWNSLASVGCQSVDLFFFFMNFYNAVSLACLFHLNFNKINFLSTSCLCKDVFSYTWLCFFSSITHSFGQ